MTKEKNSDQPHEDIAWLDVASLRAAQAERRLSAGDVTEFFFDRIERLAPTLGAFVSLQSNRARERARPGRAARAHVTYTHNSKGTLDSTRPAAVDASRLHTLLESSRRGKRRRQCSVFLRVLSPDSLCLRVLYSSIHSIGVDTQHRWSYRVALWGQTPSSPSSVMQVV